MMSRSVIPKSVPEILYDLSDGAYYGEGLKYLVNPLAIVSL